MHKLVKFLSFSVIFKESKSYVGSKLLLPIRTLSIFLFSLFQGTRILQTAAETKSLQGIYQWIFTKQAPHQTQNGTPK